VYFNICVHLRKSGIVTDRMEIHLNVRQRGTDLMSCQATAVVIEGDSFIMILRSASLFAFINPH